MYSKSKHFNESNLISFAGKEGFWLNTGEKFPAFLEKDKINNKFDELYFSIFVNPLVKITILSKKQVEVFYSNVFDDIFRKGISVYSIDGSIYNNVISIDKNGTSTLVKYIRRYTNSISVDNMVINTPHRYNSDTVRIGHSVKYVRYDPYYGWNSIEFSDEEIQNIYKEVLPLIEKD